jgi:signal transduction histidine kinase
MFQSLRARLLLWYTAILAAVIVVFGVTVCLVAWRNRVTEVDARLTARADVLAQSIQRTAGDTFDVALPQAPDPLESGLTDPQFYHALWNDEGKPLDQPDPDRVVPLPAGPGARTRDGNREVTIRAESDALVLVGQSLEDVRAELWALGVTIAVVGAGALALSLGGGWWLVGRALTPVDRISRTARAMVDGDFAARIPIDRVETELGQVARALNDAFDQLNASIERQRRFTADASHELRTPLATISTEVQWALGRDRRTEEYQRSLQACGRAATRMQSVVERLLALARAEAGAAADRAEILRLDGLVQDTARDVASLARARNVTVEMQLAPAVVRGDRDRLHEAIANLLTNAVQYNVEGGRVRLDLTTTDGAASLAVADTGIGIGDADLPKVFEAFFRADPARSRDVGGAGLGLAVTRAVVERHGGRIACRSEVGRGTTMTIRLPLAATGTPGTTPR